MNKYQSFKCIWITPLVAIIIQIGLILFCSKIIPYNMEDIKGKVAFWIIYAFYAIIVLASSYIYILLIQKFKKWYKFISIITIVILILLLFAVSYVLSNQDFALTLVIIFALQLCYSIPFHFGVYKCFNQV